MPLPKRGLGISIQWRHGHDNASSDDDKPPVDQGLPLRWRGFVVPTRFELAFPA